MVFTSEVQRGIYDDGSVRETVLVETISNGEQSVKRLARFGNFSKLFTSSEGSLLDCKNLAPISVFSMVYQDRSKPGVSVYVPSEQGTAEFFFKRVSASKLEAYLMRTLNDLSINQLDSYRRTYTIGGDGKPIVGSGVEGNSGAVGTGNPGQGTAKLHQNIYVIYNSAKDLLLKSLEEIAIKDAR